ncbi:hypothetical protein M514_06587 [Trichuris suis]|uniref:G-protein coupled receptors family 1 profile domain-containing protein n=1 Tax=Trichuris suis TaxID=68888 RepID=A0A085N2K3_9BILA|nr:hypothetical protein M514_06587 [Trichuris suis]
MANESAVSAVTVESSGNWLEPDSWIVTNGSIPFTVFVMPQLEPFRYVDIVLSIVVVIESGLCALTILLNKVLMRSNIAILVALLFIAYVVLNFGILANQLITLIYFKQEDEFLATGSLCFLKWVLLACGGAFVIDISFLIAFDRCAASVFGLSFYHCRKRWWLFAKMILVSLHLVSITLRLGVDWLQDDFALCTVVELVKWEGFLFVRVEYNALITATLVMYVFGIIWGRHNVRRHSSRESIAATRKAQLRQKMLVTLTLSFFLSSFSFVATSVIVVISAYVQDKSSLLAVLKFLCLNSIGSFLSINLLLIRTKQIRQAIVGLCVKKRPAIRDSLTTFGVAVTNDQMSISQLWFG